MIIGHYDHEIWAKGGMATYIRRISNAQREAGHQVHFLTRFPCDGSNLAEAPIVTPTEPELFTQAERLNVDVLHLHRSIAVPPPKYLPTLRTLHGHQPYCPSGSRFLERWHKPCDRAYSPVGCLWGHIVDRCGSIRPHNLVNNFQQTQQEQTVLSQIPVITVSHFLKEQMVRNGYPDDLIHVLHLFAPEGSNNDPPPQTETPHFVFLGRIAPQKGVDWLLRSLQQVKHPVHLDIAGEGEQEAEMKALAEKLGVGDRVTFHGWVDTEKINQLICGARALIFPSLWHEPAGLVAFEAMANSRAVIASCVGGISSTVIQGVNGLLVTPNSVNELAASVEYLATDWKLAMKLGAAGRSMASQQYTLTTHMAGLFCLYEMVIRRNDQ
jgi:glycosyltransferase involved in cell wall biosynthesis